MSCLAPMLIIGISQWQIASSASLDIRQTIVNMLPEINQKSSYPHYPFYALNHPRLTSLERVAFDNDNITSLFLDMHLKSINGIKRWPKDLERLWIMNMHDFDMRSLNQVPESVTILGLLRNDFATYPVNQLINLPKNLKYLYIQMCEAPHETIGALDIAPLSQLIHLHLIYLDKTQYSAQYPIILPQNLEHLEINYVLIEKMLTHQKRQNMQKLRCVIVNKNKEAHGHEDKIRKLQGPIARFFNVRNLTVLSSDTMRF